MICSLSGWNSATHVPLNFFCMRQAVLNACQLVRKASVILEFTVVLREHSVVLREQGCGRAKYGAGSLA